MDPKAREYLAEIGEEDVPWVASRLKEFGGRAGWALGTKLCR